MENGKSCFSGTLRWLGVAADAVAGVFSGAPIGFTTDVTNAPRATGDSSSTEEANDEDEDRVT
jgi:hypothetical protein